VRYWLRVRAGFEVPQAQLSIAIRAPGPDEAISVKSGSEAASDAHVDDV
jgi:hypothetical protein